MTVQKIRGYSAYRLPHNPREAIFAEAWEEYQQKDGSRPNALLDHLVGLNERGTRLERVATEEEHRIAATVIQWLGSPVGFRWLDEVLKKIEAMERKA